MTIKVTAEFEIEGTIDEADLDALVGEVVSVKSGQYENMLIGHITSAAVEPTE